MKLRAQREKTGKLSKPSIYYENIKFVTPFLNCQLKGIVSGIAKKECLNPQLADAYYKTEDIGEENDPEDSNASSHNFLDSENYETNFIPINNMYLKQDTVQFEEGIEEGTYNTSAADSDLTPSVPITPETTSTTPTAHKEDQSDDMDFFRSLLPMLKLIPIQKRIKFRRDVLNTLIDYSDSS